MSFNEKRTWIYLIASLVTYGGYLFVVIGRARDTPVAEVPYASALLWAIVASTVVSTLGQTLFAAIRPGAALFMAMAEWDQFWIANAIYLGFVLWAVVGAALTLVAYRRGL